MRKYWHVIKIGLENTLVYRFNFFFRAIFSLVPLLATILMWRAIYGQSGPDHEISGYSLGRMISYYLMITIVEALTSVSEDDWQIAADIRDGNISQFLLKPIDYLGYRLCLFASGRLIYTCASAIPVGVFICFYSESLLPPASADAFFWFVISVFLAAMLQFFISYTLALLAFWLLEVSTVIFIVFAFEYIAGGHLFPLNILPPILERLLNFTPFPYELFFPVSIYMGQQTGAALYQGLAIQVFWVVFFFGMARFVWSRGIRKYAAVGG